MRTILYCLALVGLGTAVFAEDPPTEPNEKFGPEARTAFLRWQKARAEADTAYVSALRASLEKVTRQGKLDEAVAIRAEIKRISGHMNEGKAVPLFEFLVGTSWVSNFNGVVVVLEKDGKGKRQHQGNEKPLTYQVVSENEFKLNWPAAPATQCVLAKDRRSFVAGDVTWTLKR